MAKTFDAVVTIAGKVDPSMEKSIQKAEKSYSGLGAKVKTFAKVGVAGVAALGAATVVATKGLFDLGESYQEASNTIRIGTGATGEALDELNSSLKDVYQSVPTNLEDASQAIADWNTRLGLTGDNLETLSKQALEVSNMLGEDMSATIEESSQAFKQWDISADDMSTEMDYIYKLSQSTGMGFTDLMSHVQSSGAVLQTLGYNFDEAAAMIGNLDKAGVNTEQVLKGMKKGLGNIAKDGGDAVGAMKEYCTQIAAASSETEAITIATNIFGSATAVTMAQAIRKGALDVDGLTKSLQENSESILGAAEDTYTLKDRWEMLKAKGSNMLEPMATGVLEIATNAFPLLESALDNIMPVVESVGPLFTEGLGEAVEVVKPILESLSTALMQIIPPLVSVIGNVRSQVMSALSQIGPPITRIIENILPRAQILIEKLMPVFSGMASAVGPLIDKLINSLAPVLEQIVDVAMQLFDAVLPIIDAILPLLEEIGDLLLDSFLSTIQALLPPIQSILSALSPLIQLLSRLITAIMPGLTALIDIISFGLEWLFNLLNDRFAQTMDFLGIYIAEVINMVTGVIDWLSSAIGGFIDFFYGIGETIGSIFGTIQSINQATITGVIRLISNVKGVFTSFIGFIRGTVLQPWINIFNSMRDAVGSAFAGLAEIVKTPMNAVIGVINKAISGINSINIDIPKGVPLVGGKHVGFNIPTIPTLGTGGFTEGVSIAGEAGQEAVISFNPKYKKQNLSYWAEAGRRLGVNDNYSTILETGKRVLQNVQYVIENISYSPNIYVSGSANKAEIDAAMEESKEAFFDKLDEWIDSKLGGGDFEPEFI